MPGLRDQFAPYYMPNGDAIATAMKTGLVVPDANVLLNLYRFQSEARDQLFGALQKAGDRLWIPHQVGFEFHKNRLTVMSDQAAYFAKTEKELTDSIEALRGKFRAFRARIALSLWNSRDIEETLSRLGDLVEKVVRDADGANEIRLYDHANDAVLTRIDALFEKSVGSPMEPRELEDARREAERRIKEKIPPGYMDKKKDDPTGDYLVWRQLLTKAADKKLPVVFITDDTKDDWYQHEHGLTLGARRELREEMAREAGVPLLMMTTETFLRHAKTHLDATVSDETVDQAKEIPSDQPDVINDPFFTEWITTMAAAVHNPGLREELTKFARTGEVSQLVGVLLPVDPRSQRPEARELTRVAVEKYLAAVSITEAHFRRSQQAVTSPDDSLGADTAKRDEAWLSDSYGQDDGLQDQDDSVQEQQVEPPAES